MNSRILEVQRFIKPYGKCVVAYSGGVDSSFLLYALSSFGEGNVTAVTFKSSVSSIKEIESATDFAISLGVEHMVINFDHLEIVGNNPKNRCYLCKKYMFSRLHEIMLSKGYDVMLDGSNFDDLKSDRPGRLAGREYNILSPLEVLNFTKKEIRDISLSLNLNIANKPSKPCYLTRFPHYICITDNMMRNIKSLEDYISEIGIKQFRARYIDKDNINLELGLGNLELSDNLISSIEKCVLDLGYQNLNIIYSDTNFDKI